MEFVTKQTIQESQEVLHANSNIEKETIVEGKYGIYNLEKIGDVTSVKISLQKFPCETKEEAEQALIALSYKKDELKKQYEQLNEQLEKALTALGVDHFFKDADGTVYKVVVPKGSYVGFKHIDFVRTKRGMEKVGSLSQKEAKELMGE